MRPQDKYLTAEPVHSDEAGYVIEDGVLIDIEERPTARKAYDEWTRYWAPSPADKKAEELAWAQRSGPCVTIRPATKQAPTTRKKAVA